MEKGGFYIGRVKWRNQLLALFCLVVFFAVGIFYFRYWVIQKPFGIILFIGEGLDAETLAAARIAGGGMERPLTIDSLPYTALLKNYSANSAIPDAAAAATAMATGAKVRNGSVAMDAAGNRLTSLFELARESGRMTGLITDGSVTSPTTASFYAHAKKPNEWANFAQQLVDAGNIDVVLGGGAGNFLPQSHGGRRTDGKDLVSAADAAGYDMVQTLEELEKVPRWRRAKLFGLFSEQELAFGDEEDAREDQPTLSDMVRRGIELLQFHRGGYLLVVDATLMRKAARANQGERRLAEALELDRAVSIALQYTGNASAIFVCNDVAEMSQSASAPVSAESSAPAETPVPVETLPPIETPAPAEPVSATATHVAEEQIGPPTLGVTPAAAMPSSDSPVASASPQTPVFASGAPSPVPSPAELPAASNTAPPVSTGPKTAEDVLAFGSGLGAEALHGTQENSAIFEIINDNL